MRLLAPSFLLALTACGAADFSGTTGRTASKPPTGKSGDAVPAPSPAPAPAPAPASAPTGPAVPTPAPSPPAGNVPQDNVLAAIDSACASNAGGGGFFSGLSTPLAPAQAPLPRTAPADCRTAYEFNDFHGTFTLDATPAGGSRAVTLEVDIATYEAPDRLRILADGPGGEKVILDTCRLKTSTYTDPTDGDVRPPEDSVRYFRPVLPAGTTGLRFDFSSSFTPQYIRIAGLCDFAPSPVGGTPALRRVP